MRQASAGIGYKAHGFAVLGFMLALLRSSPPVELEGRKMIYGITVSGEKLGFEIWAYSLWISGLMRDADLSWQFSRCRFA